jgi:hypothetical protein
MPVSLTFEEPSLFIIRASGVVRFEEAFRASNLLLSDLRLRNGAAVLVECDQVVEVPSVGALAVLADLFRAIFAAGVRRMAIAWDGDLARAAAQTFAVFANSPGTDVRLFQEAEEARCWLTDAARARTAT